MNHQLSVRYKLKLLGVLSKKAPYKGKKLKYMNEGAE